MTAQFTILTVCTGNIHRSPFAAGLLETWAGWYLPGSLSGDIRVRSAGLAAVVDAPMGRRASKLLASFGADGSRHSAAQITDELIAEADLVLVATRRHRDEVLGRVPAALRRTFTIREAGRVAAAISAPLTLPSELRDLTTVVGRLADARSAHTPGDDDDLIDPQGRGDSAFIQMTTEEVIPLAQLAAVLFGMPGADLEAYIAAAGDQAALTELLAEATPR